MNVKAVFKILFFANEVGAFIFSYAVSGISASSVT